MRDATSASDMEIAPRRMTGDTSLMRLGLSGEAQAAIDAARSELEGQ